MYISTIKNRRQTLHAWYIAIDFIRIFSDFHQSEKKKISNKCPQGANKGTLLSTT